jgi:predicted transcriptional regulator
VRLKEVVSILDCEVLSGQDGLDVRVSSCFAADLMSDVLRFSCPDALLITGLTSLQSVHTVDMADFRGIMFVGNKRPASDALQLARDKHIPVLVTRHAMFEACGLLYENSTLNPNRRVPVERDPNGG